MMDPIKRPECWGIDAAYEVADPECADCTFKHSCAAHLDIHGSRTETDNVQTLSKRQTYFYCEKAPPRGVLEASGLVYSLGLKAEYERHVRHFKVYGGNYPMFGTFRLVPDVELRGRALPVPWHAPLAEFHSTRDQPVSVGYSLYGRCLLCGGWIRETTITPENDLRLQKKEELFTSAVPRVLYAQPKEAKTAPLGNTPAYEKRVKHLKSHEVAQHYKEKLATRENAAKEAFNAVYRPQKPVEGFGECKSCVRGPYTFTIEYRPGYGVFMRATSDSRTGTVLVSEKNISEADLQTISVKMVWDKFVEDLWPPAAQHMVEQVIKAAAIGDPSLFTLHGDQTCPIRNPESCSVAHKHLSCGFCDHHCPRVHLRKP